MRRRVFMVMISLCLLLLAIIGQPKSASALCSGDECKMMVTVLVHNVAADKSVDDKETCDDGIVCYEWRINDFEVWQCHEDPASQSAQCRKAVVAALPTERWKRFYSCIGEPSECKEDTTAAMLLASDIASVCSTDGCHEEPGE